MYNEEFKKQYIQARKYDYKDAENVITVIFNRVGKFENRLKKDCCNFSKREITEMFVDFNTPSRGSLVNTCSQLRTYTEYCIDKGVVRDNENHYNEINADDYSSFINADVGRGRIITRTALLDLFISNALRNPCDQFLCLGIFEGIGGPGLCEFVNLKMSDFNGQTVQLNTGRVLSVSSELIAIAQRSSDTYEKYAIWGETSVNSSKPLMENDNNIIKSSINAVDMAPEKKARNIRDTLAYCRKAVDVDALRTKSLTESGRIEMINNFMASGKYITWKDAYKAHAKEIDYRYQPSWIEQSHLKAYEAQYGDFLR